jgi:hypothetical protein
MSEIAENTGIPLSTLCKWTEQYSMNSNWRPGSLRTKAKGMWPQQMQPELSDVYHEHAFQPPAVEKWHLPFADMRRSLQDKTRSGRPMKNDLRGRIAELMCEKRFTLCKVRCGRRNTPKTTCLRVLHEKLGLTKFYLCWLPQTLEVNQIAERVTLSYQRLHVLRSDDGQNFRIIIRTNLGSSWERP